MSACQPGELFDAEEHQRFETLIAQLAWRFVHLPAPRTSMREDEFPWAREQCPEARGLTLRQTTERLGVNTDE